MIHNNLKIQNSRKYNSNKDILSDLKANGWVNLKNIFTKDEVLNLEKEINHVSKKMSGYNKHERCPNTSVDH